MHTFPAIPWLEDWSRTIDPFAQKQYVRSELERIAKAGAPVLSMVLTAPFEIQTQLAMSALHENALRGHRYWLRLVPKANPPINDPQGRTLPEEERGKVLVAKVGTKGGQLRQTHKLPGYVTAEFDGPNVQNASDAERDIYEYVRIGHDPIELTLSEAVLVMRRYGWQIAHPRYKGKAKRRNEKGEIVPNLDVYGAPVPVIDFWMVEEIPPSAIAPDGSVREPSKSGNAQQNSNKQRAA